MRRPSELRGKFTARCRTEHGMIYMRKCATRWTKGTAETIGPTIHITCQITFARHLSSVVLDPATCPSGLGNVSATPSRMAMQLAAAQDLDEHRENHDRGHGTSRWT